MIATCQASRPRFEIEENQRWDFGVRANCMALVEGTIAYPPGPRSRQQSIQNAER